MSIPFKEPDTEKMAFNYDRSQNLGNFLSNNNFKNANTKPAGNYYNNDENLMNFGSNNNSNNAFAKPADNYYDSSQNQEKLTSNANPNIPSNGNNFNNAKGSINPMNYDLRNNSNIPLYGNNFNNVRVPQNPMNYDSNNNSNIPSNGNNLNNLYQNNDNLQQFIGNNPRNNSIGNPMANGAIPSQIPYNNINNQSNQFMGNQNPISNTNEFLNHNYNIPINPGNANLNFVPNNPESNFQNDKPQKTLVAPIPLKRENTTENPFLNHYIKKMEENISAPSEFTLFCNSLNFINSSNIQFTEELLKYIQSVPDQSESPLINFQKYQQYIPLQYQSYKGEPHLNIASRLISSFFISMIIAIKNRNMSNREESSNVNILFSTLQSILNSDAGNLNALVNDSSLDFTNIISKVKEMEPKLVNFHLLRLKYFINNQMSKLEIYSQVIHEMETTYKMPIDFLFFDENRKLGKIKTGNFKSSIRAKFAMNLEEGKNCLYFFLKNPNYESFKMEPKKISLKLEEKEKLKSSFQDAQKFEQDMKDKKLMSIIEPLLSKEIDSSEICQIIIAEYIDMTNQLLSLKNSNRRKKDDINEDEVIIKIKKCNKCKLKSKFINFPCEEDDEENKYQNDICLECRKEVIKNLSNYSEKKNKCKKCKKAPHKDHLNAMKEVLQINPNRNKGKNVIKNNLQEFNDNDSEENRNSKQNEGPPNFQPPWSKNTSNNNNPDNQSDEEDKIPMPDLNQKTIHRADNKNDMGSKSKNNVKPGYTVLDYNIEKNEPNSIEFVGNLCTFCNKGNGKLEINDGCFKVGCSKFHYHKDCLSIEAKQKVNSGKKLSDVKCLHCNESFYYSQIRDVDKESADILRDRQYSNSSVSSSNNRNQNADNGDHLNLKQKCDIQHDHIKDNNPVVLGGVLCLHEYFIGCLRNYLSQNLASFKSIDEVKCPVNRCNVFILPEVIRTNFPDLAKQMKPSVN